MCMWRGHLLGWVTAPEREDPEFRLVRWEMLVTLSAKIGSRPFQKRARAGGMAGAVIALSPADRSRGAGELGSSGDLICKTDRTVRVDSLWASGD